jgi:hypothetical protein
LTQLILNSFTKLSQTNFQEDFDREKKKLFNFYEYNTQIKDFSS